MMKIMGLYCREGDARLKMMIKMKLNTDVEPSHHCIPKMQDLLQKPQIGKRYE